MSFLSAASQRLEKVEWSSLIFIVTYHLVLLVTLPLYLLATTPSWTLVAAAVFLLMGSLLAVTAGYHRLYAHKTYRTKTVVESILLFFGTLAVQGSALKWAHDHRLHHNHVDSDGDPYGTQKGFWHSHLLWMFKKREVYDERYVADLNRNRLLVFQDRHYGWLMVAVNVLAVAALWWITGDLIGAFVIGFLVRLFVAHHCTWFINSLAHMWGSKPYSVEHSAVNNFILALLTYGEGYHNYHHTFAGDYRNGVRWYQFDPPKYLIWMLSKVGLASDLKRTDRLMIDRRLIQVDRKLLMDHLSRVRDNRAKELAELVEKTSERLTTMIASARSLRDRYLAVKASRNKQEFRELRACLRQHRQEISRELRSWRRLCRQVLKMEPAV